ncbi:MAG: hypothetical protein HZA20_11415 [Nitrospirae bacterium]|nr:hypothetical protein [Nitrospirota bacterium]
MAKPVSGTNAYGFEIQQRNSPFVAIDTNGKVGIGTTSPQHILTLHKNIDSGCDPSDPYMCSYGFDESTAQWTTSFTGNSRYDGLSIGMNFDSSARIVNYEGGGITFETGGATRLHLSSYDNVALKQYAVRAYGSLDITGNLSKGSGTFHIDHPLDPANKDLYHGFVEAPRYDLIYRGMVQLKNGRATVNVDAASNMTNGTFDALTQNPQVFLQNDTGFSAVKGKIKKGTLTIECADAKSNDTIGWLVIAERADAYVKSNGTTDANGHLLVEVDKPEPTANELALLKDKVEVVDDDGQADKEDVRTEDVNELSGRRGYPIHPKAFGKAQPQRKVTRKHVKKAE